jgi:hypothetical protein
MPTDPFVADRLDDQPRQMPTLSPGVRVPPARGWWADRPGDLADGVQPRGNRFGSPGPNIGYALLLVRRMHDQFELTPLEHLHDVDAVVAALAMKRAASFGRAPVPADIESAALTLGYLSSPSGEFVEWRAQTVDGAGHDYDAARKVVDAIPLEVLRLAPSALAPRAADVHAALMSST